MSPTTITWSPSSASCSAATARASSRTTRRTGHPRTGTATAAAATAAQKELVKVLAQCQADKGYKDATGALVPYDFKTLKNIPAGVVADGNRVFVHAVIDSGVRARTLLGLYQFNGDTFTGLYVMNAEGFSDAQVAKWLKVAVTMANRLQGKTA